MHFVRCSLVLEADFKADTARLKVIRTQRVIRRTFFTKIQDINMITKNAILFDFPTKRVSFPKETPRFFFY